MISRDTEPAIDREEDNRKTGTKRQTYRDRDSERQKRKDQPREKVENGTWRSAGRDWGEICVCSTTAEALSLQSAFSCITALYLRRR